MPHVYAILRYLWLLFKKVRRACNIRFLSVEAVDRSQRQAAEIEHQQQLQPPPQPSQNDKMRRRPSNQGFDNIGEIKKDGGHQVRFHCPLTNENLLIVSKLFYDSVQL